jgi:hypothetical protein
MEKPGHCKRPAALLENKHYFLKLPEGNWSIPRFIQVTFVGYTTCPAVVIVQDGKMRHIKCKREDLFCTHVG